MTVEGKQGVRGKGGVLEAPRDNKHKHRVGGDRWQEGRETKETETRERGYKRKRSTKRSVIASSR